MVDANNLVNPNEDLRELAKLGVDTIDIQELSYQHRYNGVSSTLVFLKEGKPVNVSEVIDEYDIEEMIVADAIQRQMEEDDQVDHSDGEPDWNGDETVSTEFLKEALSGFVILVKGKPIGKTIDFDYVGDDS